MDGKTKVVSSAYTRSEKMAFQISISDFTDMLKDLVNCDTKQRWNQDTPLSDTRTGMELFGRLLS